MPTPKRSAFVFEVMRRHLRRYLAKHFHALRVSKTGPIPDLPRESVLLVLNHPSWWDPLVGLALSSHFPKWRVHYGPIESKGLAQYPFLGRLGFFGVDSSSTKGVLEFLRSSREIMDRSESILWITAQGRFTDTRVRPPALREGVGHLVHRLPSAIVLPLALEYTFWNDRCPEILVRFGEPLRIENGRSRSPNEWTASIEAALQETQDLLAREAMRRDPTEFDLLLGGSAGVGGIYDAWRRFKAWLSGNEFRPEHQIAPEARVEAPWTSPPTQPELHEASARS